MWLISNIEPVLFVAAFGLGAMAFPLSLIRSALRDGASGYPF